MAGWVRRAVREWLGITSEVALDTVQAQVSAINLGPNDIVVISTEDVLTKEQAETILNQWDEAIAAGRKTVVLTAGVKLQVLSRAA